MAATPERELSDELKKERLILYRESNDALRDLLMGRFGRLPLGFPPEWVYEITIMKQEKAVLATLDGIVERVLKTADFKHDKKMVPVREGELLVVLGPVPKKCGNCQAPVKEVSFRFCPQCGASVA